MILDNRDLEKECGFRLSIVDIAPGKESALSKLFIPSIVEVTFYDAQRQLHSIQSAPRDLHDRWSHVLFTSSVAEAQRSLLSVEVDGVTLLSSAVSRGLPVATAAPLTARASSPCTWAAPPTATTASRD